MPSIKYAPQLDGLRAVCIVFTLFNHIEGCPPYLNGSVGVDVFFPLSGFLITGILLKSGWGDLRGYYIRRFYRIAPVYYLALALTVLAALATNHAGVGASRADEIGKMIWPSMLFSRELGTTATHMFGQAWTVGIEEKFYLLWPLLFLAMGAGKGPVLALAAVLGLVAWWGDVESFRGYGGIALGCLSAMAFFERGLHIRTGWAALMVVGAYVFCTASDFWWRNISMSLAAAFLIPSLFATESLLGTALSRPSLVQAGKLTFSVYMLHVLVLNMVKLLLDRAGVHHWLMTFLVGYAITLVCAWALYRFYEYPLILYGKALASREAASLERQVPSRI